MNSEELELSLRTEFESYLKGVLADLRQDVSEFQTTIEAEFEKHRSQTDEAFRNLAKRFESKLEFDQSFSESVVEHLRLARDDGATITAAAFGEAEKLKQDSAPAADFDKLRDAINEISSKTSQSEILGALVEAASNFTSRGVFFIVKNEHFVGWKAFGKEATVDEAAVRNIQFPISAETVLADAIESLNTRTVSHGGQTDDNLFLDPLDFGRPDRMYAIPLTARGRGVAVLYADFGKEGVKVNAEALETLVRVAGLTVELIASSQPVPVQPQTEEHGTDKGSDAKAEGFSYSDTRFSDNEPVPESNAEEVEFVEAPAEPSAETFNEASVSFRETEPAAEPKAEVVEEYTGSVSFEGSEIEETVVEATAEETVDFADYEIIPEETPAASAEPAAEEVTYFEPVEEVETTPAVDGLETFAHAQEVEAAPAETVGSSFSESAPDAEFVSSAPADTVEEVRVNEKADSVSEVFETNGAHSASANGASQNAAEPIVEAAAAQGSRTRYRDRNVDLPIEVPDEERRLHNDARRFARLLVSEIKLYNEQKVNEGRESGDLYERLREAIDRSRDMYDKRVQPPVAAKFDYFHYELVNSLAEGEDAKLGATYPGTSVPA